MGWFQIVTTDDQGVICSDLFQTDDPTAAFAVRGYEYTGKVGGDRLREELRDQPRFHGLNGPMWGGHQNGEPVTRYEDRSSYLALSR